MQLPNRAWAVDFQRFVSRISGQAEKKLSGGARGVQWPAILTNR